MAAVTDVRIQQPSVSHAVWVTGRQLSWRLIDDNVFSFILQLGRAQVIHEVCGPEAHEDRVGSSTHTSASLLQNVWGGTWMESGGVSWSARDDWQHAAWTQQTEQDQSLSIMCTHWDMDWGGNCRIIHICCINRLPGICYCFVIYVAMWRYRLLLRLYEYLSKHVCCQCVVNVHCPFKSLCLSMMSSTPYL